MRVIILGASGMIGGGVLTECLEDPQVTHVLAVGRRSLGRTNEKLSEIVSADLFDLSQHKDRFDGFDACFYCLGISVRGLSEDAYRRITVDLTFDILDVVTAANPNMTVCFVSGQGADSSGKSRMMWARVKGEAENELLSRDYTGYVFRPGVIQPLKGARSKTPLYQIPYTLLGPLIALLRRALPSYITTTVTIGRAMLRAASQGYAKSVLETADINKLGGDGV